MIREVISLADDFQDQLTPIWRLDWMPPGAPTFVPDPARSGRRALAITVRPGDCPGAGADGERTERAEVCEAGPVVLPTETEAWYGFSLYLPADFPVVDRRLVVGQWYQPSLDPALEAIRSPLVANRFRNGVFSITRQEGLTRIVCFEAPGDARGRWLDLVYHLRFSPAQGGLLQAWMDGTRIVDYAGPLAYPNAHDRVYFRLGLYRDHLPIPMTLLVRRFRRGTSWAEVASASPLTIRRAESLDGRLIAELHVRAWQTAYRGVLPAELLDTLSIDDREAMWRRKLARAGDGPIWVSERSGQVIGFAATGPSRDTGASGDVAEVYAIYLDPEVIGTGVGCALFAHAVDHLWREGYRAATLWVLESNARACRFYERAGWRPDGATQVERRQGTELREVRYRVEVP